MTEPKSERHRKTPLERAEEALGVAQRRVAKLDRGVSELETQLRQLKVERDAAIVRRDFLAKDPALPQNTPAPQPTTTTGDTPA